MNRVAVLLSGCGVFDGAEIHESVLVLLALDRANADVICNVFNVVVDRRLKIITTPAYMLAGRISEAEAGINKLVQAVLDLA